MNTDKPDGTIPPISETVSLKQSRLISKVLSPAVGLWLRSQVQQVSDLEVKISGGDRQILSGYIPHVSISARHAVYQGLHLTQIQLVGEGIRINLAAMLRGQPLRLLEPVPIFCEVLLRELDLNASLNSSLLANALTELLLKLLSASHPVDGSVEWQKIRIDNGQLILGATLTNLESNENLRNLKPLVISTGLKLASSHELKLEHPQIQNQLGLPWENLASLTLDLGPEVGIEELTLTSGQLVCRGHIKVLPSE